MPAGRNPYLMSLGKRLARLRKERGWSQPELAERAELTTKYLSEIERGVVNPSVVVIRAIAGALDVSAGRLLGDASDVDAEVAELLRGRSPEERQRALAVVRALLAPLPR